MNQQQARKLKVGDAVIWDGDPDDRSEVALVVCTCFKMAWDNSDGSSGWRNFNDAEMVSRP